MLDFTCGVGYMLHSTHLEVLHPLVERLWEKNIHKKLTVQEGTGLLLSPSAALKVSRDHRLSL